MVCFPIFVFFDVFLQPVLATLWSHLDYWISGTTCTIIFVTAEMIQVYQALMMKEGDAQKLKPVANISALGTIEGLRLRIQGLRLRIVERGGFEKKDLMTYLMFSVCNATCPYLTWICVPKSLSDEFTNAKQHYDFLPKPNVWIDFLVKLLLCEVYACSKDAIRSHTYLETIFCQGTLHLF